MPGRASAQTGWRGQGQAYALSGHRGRMLERQVRKLADGGRCLACGWRDRKAADGLTVSCTSAIEYS